MQAEQNIPELDLRVVQSVMKAGGKKKLDALIGILDASAPIRLQDLMEARTLADVKMAAQALKGSAGSLGLARLEDLCDQLLGSSGPAPNPGLIQGAQQAFDLGRAALRTYRAGI